MDECDRAWTETSDGSIPEVYCIPIGLEIPQGEEEKDIMKIKGEPDLVQFGHHADLVTVSSLKISKFRDLEAHNLGHQLLGLFEILYILHLAIR
jgi:hypothetical protein